MTPVTWMRVEATAKALGISRATLYRWIERGLPHHKVGRVVLFDQDEIDGWLRAQSARREPEQRAARGRRS